MYFHSSHSSLRTGEHESGPFTSGARSYWQSTVLLPWQLCFTCVNEWDSSFFADYWPLVVLPGISQMGIVTLDTDLTRKSIRRGEMTGVCPRLKVQFGFPFIFGKEAFGFRFLSRMCSSVQLIAQLCRTL